jgi:hypothetical protein
LRDWPGLPGTSRQRPACSGQPRPIPQSPSRTAANERVPRARPWRGSKGQSPLAFLAADPPRPRPGRPGRSDECPSSGRFAAGGGPPRAGRAGSRSSIWRSRSRHKAAAFSTEVGAQQNVKQNLMRLHGPRSDCRLVLNERFSHCANASVNQPHHRTLKPNRRQRSGCRATHSDSDWNVRHSDSQTRPCRAAAGANGLPS